MSTASPHQSLFQPEGSGISQWWRTPMLIHRWPDHGPINTELEGLILDRMRTSPGMSRSNVGGWHSDEELMTWPGPAVGQLKNWIVAAVRNLHRAVGVKTAPSKLQLTAWANVNRAGDANSTHEHGNHSWSGVYYVATGAAGSRATTGFLEFLDPRHGAGRLNVGLTALGASSLVEPEPGLMVVFPSWVLHAVRPHAEPGLRISVAFNVAEVP